MFRWCSQWHSQVIGIGWAPAVCLTIALTTLVLVHTWAGWTLAGHMPGQARPSLRHCLLLKQMLWMIPERPAVRCPWCDTNRFFFSLPHCLLLPIYSQNRDFLVMWPVVSWWTSYLVRHSPSGWGPWTWEDSVPQAMLSATPLQMDVSV